MSAASDTVLPQGWSWSDVGHGALDVAGLVPVIGEAADLANAAWYAGEGQYLEAGLSLISCVPVVGDAIGKGGKVANKLAPRAAGAAADALKQMDFAKSLAKFRTHPTLGPHVDRIVKALEDWRGGLAAKVPDSPPGAVAGCPRAKPLSLVEAKKLAAQAGDSPQHRAAREKVARAYYATRSDSISAAEIEAHISGIDLGKPVFVDNVKPGQTLYQHSFPGKTGQYFSADAGVKPDALGIKGEVLVPAAGTTPPRIVPRVKTSHPAQQEVTVLRSTAAPVTDKWSTPGQPKATQGGGEQIFLPRGAYEHLRKP